MDLISPSLNGFHYVAELQGTWELTGASSLTYRLELYRYQSHQAHTGSFAARIYRKVELLGSGESWQQLTTHTDEFTGGDPDSALALALNQLAKVESDAQRDG